jgi:hypothetical protein
MTFAQAAQKAIEYGGKFDGHELPEDINNFTKTSAKNLVGQGLMAVAKDAYPRDGQSQSFVVGSRRSRSTRDRRLPGDRLHGDRRRRHRAQPAQPEGSALRRLDAGLGHAKTQRWAYDQHYGVALARRFYQNKPPTIPRRAAQLHGRRGRHSGSGDSPRAFAASANRRSARPMARFMNANRGRAGRRDLPQAPVSLDIVLNAIENGGQRTLERCTAHCEIRMQDCRMQLIRD